MGVFIFQYFSLTNPKEKEPLRQWTAHWLLLCAPRFTARLHHLSVPQFPRISNGHKNSTKLIAQLWGSMPSYTKWLTTRPDIWSYGRLVTKHFLQSFSLFAHRSTAAPAYLPLTFSPGHPLLVLVSHLKGPSGSRSPTCKVASGFPIPS